MAIQVFENLDWLLRVVHNDPDSAHNHRDQHRRLEPFAAHAADDEQKTVIVLRKNLKEVAAHVPCGPVFALDSESWKGRHCIRHKDLLHLARLLHLLLQLISLALAPEKALKQPDRKHEQSRHCAQLIEMDIDSKRLESSGHVQGVEDPLNVASRNEQNRRQCQQALRPVVANAEVSHSKENNDEGESENWLSDNIQP